MKKGEITSNISFLMEGKNVSYFILIIGRYERQFRSAKRIEKISNACSKLRFYLEFSTRCLECEYTTQETWIN